MPKLKTSRAAAKRFKRMTNGRYKRAQSHLNHILTKKRTKRKRHLRPLEEVSSVDTRAVRRLLPYG